MKSFFFPYLVLLFKRQHRFDDAGVVTSDECHEICSNRFASVVDGMLWREVYDFLYSPTHQLNSSRSSPNPGEQSFGLHVNVMFDFERNKWINVNSGRDFNSSLWHNQANYEPAYPVMDDRIVLYGTCIDYLTESSRTAKLLGTVVYNGESEQTQPLQMSYEDAVVVCGSKGLWFPVDTQTFELTMDMVSTANPFQLIWTGARRYNESHFIFNGKTFDVTHLESCAVAKTGTFRSNVIVTRRYDQVYSVSFEHRHASGLN